MIFQYSGLIIDLGEVDHCAIQEPTESRPYYWIYISFKQSPKITSIRCTDGEHAVVLLSRIKRGMIAAITGNFDVLGDDFYNGGTDDDEPKSPANNPD